MNNVGWLGAVFTLAPNSPGALSAPDVVQNDNYSRRGPLRPVALRRQMGVPVFQVAIFGAARARLQASLPYAARGPRAYRPGDRYGFGARPRHERPHGIA